jgi:hypothetical protein
MNVLHYAVINENEEMIKLIVFADAESNSLLNDKNFRNETPIDMDDRKKYELIFKHIWDSSMMH